MQEDSIAVEEMHTLRPKEQTFRNAIVTGTLWSASNLLLTKILQLIIKLILARLLLPTHFGIVGIAVVFTSIIAVLGEMGLSAALIRGKDDEVTDIHLDTVFWASMVVNLAIYSLLLLLVGPLVAWFYDQPLLKPIIAITALQVLFHPLSLVQRIIITRDLDFKKLNILQILPVFVSGTVSVGMALGGFGVWSIVVHSVAASVLTVPFYWVSVDWRPRMRFSFQALREVLGLGIYDTLQRTLLTTTRNIDYLIVGRMIGAESLGLYTLAFTITDIFRQQIMSVLNKVMFPVYGKLQSDLSKIKTYYLLVVRYNTIATTMIMLPLVLYAPSIITLVFGSRWRFAATAVRLLAVASIIHAMGGTSGSVLNALGKFNIQFKITGFVTALVMIPGFLVATSLWGINGTASVVLLGKIVTRMIAQVYMRKYINVTERDIALSIKPVLIATLPSLSAHGLLFLAFEIPNPAQGTLAAIVVMCVFTVCALFQVKHEIRTYFPTKGGV